MKTAWMYSFIAIADMHSFSKAADSLFITQPAISKQIKNIEEELGIELFDRSSHTLALTAAGTLFYKYAKKFIAVNEEMTEAIEKLKRSDSLEIRIASVPITLSYGLMNLISEYTNLYPKHSVHFTEDNLSRVMQSFNNGDADFAVVRMDTLEDRERFNYIPLVKIDGPCIACSANHRFASMESVPIRMLKEERVIATSNSVDEIQLSISQKWPELIPFSFSFTSMNLPAIYDMVSRNSGVILTSRSVIDSMDPDHTLCSVPIRENENQYVCVLYNKDIPSYQLSFLDFLKSHSEFL